MTERSDPYWKLRAPPPTPADEFCECSDCPPIVLQPHLSANPLVCLHCNLEVVPERFGFSEQLAEEIAFWQTFYHCHYRLWLDSGEFEAWAKAELERPTSPVNRRGRALVEELNKYQRSYYDWFQDVGDENFAPLVDCPNCNQPLTVMDELWVCESCSIVVRN